MRIRRELMALQEMTSSSRGLLEYPNQIRTDGDWAGGCAWIDAAALPVAF